MAKMPDWRKYYTAGQFEVQLKQLCRMAKSWDLTAKLNIPELTDPDFDPIKNPIQLNLLPEQKMYIEKKRHCNNSDSCIQLLARSSSIDLQGIFATNSRRRAFSKKVIRKEYRIMSDKERQIFHKAIIDLKKKTTSKGYNAYDLHASMHSAAYAPQAHLGCGFIPFHRIYLLMLEKQLQDVSGDRSLAIPYWDSTLDSTLPHPCDSIIFSDEMLGPSNGIINSGPFANFQSPMGVISRNCKGDRTIRVGDFAMLRRFTNYSQFCYCISGHLELIHGTVHTLVNGIMNDLDKASYDPCFWMHHAFIDKMYEDIQRRWKVKPNDAGFKSGSCLSKGIDGLNEPMFPFGRRDKKSGKVIGLANKDGLKTRFTKEDYEYAPSPSCTRKTCTGKYLFCDADICKSRIRNGGRCDEHLFNLMEEKGINCCLEGYRCRPEDSSPCEQKQLSKLPRWNELYTDEDQLKSQLKELCRMEKSWDLSAKLNIPQLNDPKLDLLKNPIKLNLSPHQKRYIDGGQRCKNGSVCLKTLAQASASGRKLTQKSIVRIKRQATPLKVVRKEYRAMSDQERRKFHRAILALKNAITSNGYNAFDLHASLHSAAYAPQAHFGCAFIPFHRIYLL
uniref:Tyrosinase copper-binding domain-containing protein n=1 Tax=Romanomermis culicivorax TaxID=13658 RepID=A0A915JY09_ROMCU